MLYVYISVCVCVVLFIYGLLGLRCCARSGPVVVSGAAPHCSAQVPTAVAALGAKLGLRGCGRSVLAHGSTAHAQLVAPAALVASGTWALGPGVEPTSPVLAGRFCTLRIFLKGTYLVFIISCHTKCFVVALVDVH